MRDRESCRRNHGERAVDGDDEDCDEAGEGSVDCPATSDARQSGGRDIMEADERASRRRSHSNSKGFASLAGRANRTATGKSRDAESRRAACEALLPDVPEAALAPACAGGAGAAVHRVCRRELRLRRAAQRRALPSFRRGSCVVGAIAIVDEEFIEALRLREDERGYVVPDEVARGTSAGSTVRVMAGPPEDPVTVVTADLRGEKRAAILMEFLRSRHEVEVDATALAVVRA